MKNFPVEHDGKTYWVSRSIAVLCYVFAYINGRMCLLANKRGTGVDKTGKWNAPSGFLDYDETLEQAAARETWEETGIHVDPKKLVLFGTNSDTTRKSQNVLIIYGTYIDRLMYFKKYDTDVLTSSENCEPNEVDEIKWIPINEIDDYEWVSAEHKERITKVLNKVIEF